MKTYMITAMIGICLTIWPDSVNAINCPAGQSMKQPECLKYVDQALEVAGKGFPYGDKDTQGTDCQSCYLQCVALTSCVAFRLRTDVTPNECYLHAESLGQGQGVLKASTGNNYVELICAGSAAHLAGLTVLCCALFHVVWKNLR